MNKRYSTKPRQFGSIGFEWKNLPHQDILFSELKNHITKISVELKQLKGLLTGEKGEDWSIVTVSYLYPNPTPTILGGELSEAEEQMYGPQDKVFNYVNNNYHQAIEMFIQAWDRAKHDTLRKNTKLKSPFITASTSQRLAEEFYKSKKDPKRFAEKLNKDKSNIYKELKGDRKISVDQAIQYSQEFGCDPVTLLFEDLTTELWGNVDFFNDVYLDENYPAGRISPQVTSIVKVPRDIYSPDIKAVQIKTKGSYLNNYIAYYYYSKNADKSAHGKLSVVGQQWINDDIGINETYYFLGIYEEKIGGGANILNPDPLAKNKYICKDMKDNITFISPVVSLVHPSTLRENYNKREALQYTDKVFEQQKVLNDLEKRIANFKVAAEKMSNAQKESEIELIEQLVKAEQDKDSSFFRKLLRTKKSA